MFKLGELERWVSLSKTALRFTSEGRRDIRLEVLAEEPANLYVAYEGHTHFIGGFEGYDVVQFSVPGVFTLTAKGGPVKVFTPEVESAGAVEIPEAVSFTKMMTRRQRNPELEVMMHKVQQNMEARIAGVERDMTLRLQNERRISEAAAHRAALAEARIREAESIVDGEPSDEDADEDEASTA